MYGLPKTQRRHYSSVRSIMNLEIGWLAGLLQPVLERFSSHCISDSFTFVMAMQNLDIDLNVFMCSFDVSSLFTSVPFDETIKTCSDVLNDDSNLQPLIPKDVFVELMKSATSSVEFSFSNTMYKQTDGVAWDHHLVLFRLTSLLDIMKRSYFLKRKSLQHTSDMLTTRLLSSITKLKQMNS